MQVDADAHRELGEKFGVRGFPTIKFFGRGQSTVSPEEYVTTRSCQQPCLGEMLWQAATHPSA